MTINIGAKALIPNPALMLFEPLIGKWQTTGTHPYMPNTTLQGRVVFEWAEGGAFVVMRSEIDDPKFPDGVAIIGSDDDANEYYMIYFDERGVSRKYDLAITGTQLKWWRNDTKFSQRFTMQIEKDKLVSTGEMSRAGGEWEKDLSLVCVRSNP